ncbi:hypothetical protein V1291_005414 [Nitrobacteraceae bacterium AZCC 1564]
MRLPHIDSAFMALVPRFSRSHHLAALSFANVRTRRDTSNSMKLVRLFDLTFVLRTRRNTRTNVKSSALEL